MSWEVSCLNSREENQSSAKVWGCADLGDTPTTYHKRGAK